MKKFAKMSLVAAVAVAGLTSTSSASSLEEAIKDTTISGYLRYRFNTDHETTNAETTNAHKIVVVTKTKVNDNVTATVKFAAEDTNISDTIPLTQLYFTYANGPLAVNVGRTPLVSPMTDNGNQGDGVVATYAAGPVTLAGAYYNSVLNNAGNGLDFYGVGVIGSVEMVNFAAWYLSSEDEAFGVAANQYDVYSLQADATVGPVSGYVFYAEGDDDTTDEISFLKAGLSTSFGIVSAQLNYVKTGEDSGDTTLDGDVDAEANLGLLVNDMMLVDDADAWHIGLAAKVTDTVTLGANYLSVDGNLATTGFDDATETELNAKYQMSKNFYVLGRYSFGEYDDADFAQSRIELKYSF